MNALPTLGAASLGANVALKLLDAPKWFAPAASVLLGVGLAIYMTIEEVYSA